MALLVPQLAGTLFTTAGFSAVLGTGNTAHGTLRVSQSQDATYTVYRCDMAIVSQRLATTLHVSLIGGRDTH